MTMGLFKTFGDVGVTVGPMVLGWLADSQGYGAAFRVNAVLFVVAGLSLGLFAVETVKRARR